MRSSWHSVGYDRRIPAPTQRFASNGSIAYVPTMSESEHQRPDPDELLHLLQKEEKRTSAGKLKIFFGMCAGVGKTYDMLMAAQDSRKRGVDVAVGYVETHHRHETEALVEGLTLIPRRQVHYKGAILEEMDLDAILRRKPALVLVDELAHTNAPGSRHLKRYMDVEELLDNGIDVYTTLNVQHLDSRAATVAQITGANIRETVPDSIMERADEVEVIDISPEELLSRLNEGKVYAPDQSRAAVRNFFRKGNLTALREMSLRVTADRVDRQLREYMQSKRIAGPWKSGQRLIVGVSASPHSAELIRWAARIAASQDTSWVAVHVETSREPGNAEKEQLAKNIKLARDLGAEVMSTSGEDLGEALVRVARRENCTQILIGKPRRSHVYRLRSMLTEVIDRSGNLDVYVVGGESLAPQQRRRFSIPEIHSGIGSYLVAAAIVLGVAVACFPWSATIGSQTIALVLLFTVAILPLRFGIGPVLSAAALSAVAWDFLYIEPYYTFSVAHLDDFLMLVMYFCVALVSGALTTRTRAQERAVRVREERAIALSTLSGELAVAQTKDAVVSAAVHNVRRFFDAEVVVFLGQIDGDIFTSAHPSSTFVPEGKEMTVASWVYWNEKRAGRFTQTLPGAEATYFPLSGPRYPLGVIGLRLSGPLSIDQDQLLDNFIRQISSAVERETLNDITKKAVVVEESERLYRTLFNSISHEMRTPLAAMMGTSEALLNEQAASNPELRKDLAESIHEAAERMNRLVENLLDMTRLESGLLQPRLDWCDALDIVRNSLKKLARELAQHEVVTEIADGLPLIKIDFALLEQAITNLLVNASLYSPPGARIAVSAFVEDSNLVLSIENSGPVIPPGEEEHIFDKFFRLPGSRPGGTGLGLSIARGFVQAHHGTLRAETGRREGAKFIIRLPLNPMPAHPEPGSS
jgi:two-component system sensor histidine kinase KdpD